MKNILICTFCFLIGSLHAQTFAKLYPTGGYNIAIFPVNNGYYCWQGSFPNNINRMNSNGDTLWTRGHYDSSAYIRYSSVVEDGAGGFYALASLYSTNYKHILSRIDSSGNVIWSKEYTTTIQSIFNKLALNNDRICQTSNGGYLITDTSGNMINSNDLSFLNAGAISIHNVAPAANGDFIITGQTGGSTNSFDAQDIFVIRISPSGNIIWQHIYNFGYAEEANDIMEKPNGHIVFCGRTYPIPLGPDKGLQMELDSAGNILWSKTYSYWAGVLLRDMTIDVNNHVWMTGSVTNPADSKYHLLLIETDDNGDTLFTGIFGSLSFFERGFSVTTSPSNVLLIGSAAVPVSHTLVQSLDINDPGNSCARIPSLFVISNDSFNTVTDSLIIYPSSITSALHIVNSYSAGVSIIDYCNWLGVDEQQPSIDLDVYPNPSNEQCIFSSNELSGSTIIICDVTGKIVIEQKIAEDRIAVNTSELTDGLYFYRIGSTTGKIAVVHAN